MDLWCFRYLEGGEEPLEDLVVVREDVRLQIGGELGHAERRHASDLLVGVHEEVEGGQQDVVQLLAHHLPAPLRAHAQRRHGAAPLVGVGGSQRLVAEGQHWRDHLLRGQVLRDGVQRLRGELVHAQLVVVVRGVVARLRAHHAQRLHQLRH
eukprot:2730061-Pyramimonas_sp.AAC.2